MDRGRSVVRVLVAVAVGALLAGCPKPCEPGFDHQVVRYRSGPALHFSRAVNADAVQCFTGNGWEGFRMVDGEVQFIKTSTQPDDAPTQYIKPSNMAGLTFQAFRATCAEVTFFAVRLPDASAYAASAPVIWQRDNDVASTAAPGSPAYGLCARDKGQLASFELDLFMPETECRATPAAPTYVDGGVRPTGRTCPVAAPVPSPGPTTCSGSPARNPQFFSIPVQRPDSCSYLYAVPANSLEEARGCARMVGEIVDEVCRFGVDLGGYTTYVEAAGVEEAEACARAYNCSESCDAQATEVGECQGF